jgi:glycosyltransferase involved in cell wall biosynthesis
VKDPQGRPTYLIHAQPTSRAILPQVSFCIPTKNRARTIRACLESIRAQRYPDIEIIVVDNESTDETPVIAAQYADALLRSPGPLGLVRQVSIERARGEILAIVDDDIVIPHRDWLASAVSMFQASPEISTVWPRLIPPPSAGVFTRCFFGLNDAIFRDRMARGAGVFGGGNSLFRKDAVEAIGGFDTTVDFGEDMILAGRLKDAGYSVAYCADPLVHDSMYSLREIYRKQRWGARAVARSGWEILEQPAIALVREQLVVGSRAFATGLLRDRDLTWLALPIVLAIKIWAYSASLVEKSVRRITA